MKASLRRAHRQSERDKPLLRPVVQIALDPPALGVGGVHQARPRTPQLFQAQAQLDLQPTLRQSKNSPALRQFSIHTWDDLVEERRAGMRAVIDMLAAGKLKPRIHAVLPLAQAQRAHAMLAGGEVLGKLLLKP